MVLPIMVNHDLVSLRRGSMVNYEFVNELGEQAGKLSLMPILVSDVHFFARDNHRFCLKERHIANVVYTM